MEVGIQLITQGMRGARYNRVDYISTMVGGKYMLYTPFQTNAMQDFWLRGGKIVHPNFEARGVHFIMGTSDTFPTSPLD